MKCPPEIELNEFAEDRLESRRRGEIQEHLDQCDGCRTDLEGLQWVGEQLALLDLTADAEASDHPSDADLAALAEGAVDADRKAELLSHLGVCAECARLFGALPRPQRKSALPRNFYRFAAAAAVLLCIGVFAFTGKFADHKHSGAPVVAQHGGGKIEPQEFATKPSTTQPQQPASKPAEMAAVKPTAPVKSTEPVKPTVAVKPASKPVAPAKVRPLSPAPTVVAQVTPSVATATAAAPVPRAVSAPRGGGRMVSASRTRSTRSGRTGRSHYNNMQIAMSGPQDSARSSRAEAATRDGRSSTRDKSLVTPPPAPSPAKVTAPGAPMAAMSVRPPGERSAVPYPPTTAKSTAGAAPGAGAPQGMQRSQALSQMFTQSRNDVTKKARLKLAGRHLSAGAGKLASQKPRGEVTKSNSAKSALKSLAGKSTQRSSPSSSAKSVHQHRAPATSRVAHSRSTGAHAHPGPHHA